MQKLVDMMVKIRAKLFVQRSRQRLIEAGFQHTTLSDLSARIKAQFEVLDAQQIPERPVNDTVKKKQTDFLTLDRLKVRPEYFTSNEALHQHERADWQQTHPDIQAFTAHMIYYFRQRNIPLFAHSAFRTEQEQAALLKQGRTTTRFPRASHCQGCAVDIVHARKFWDGMQPSDWAALGVLGKMIADKLDIDLVWGGDWKRPYDPAHWELRNWRDNIRLLTPTEPVRYTPTALRAKYPQR